MFFFHLHIPLCPREKQYKRNNRGSQGVKTSFGVHVNIKITAFKTENTGFLCHYVFITQEQFGYKSILL